MAAAYFAPTRMEEALSLLSDRAACVVAGGTDYFPARGTRPESRDLLDITRIVGLRGIETIADGGLRIGAATTWSDLARADLPPALYGLQSAARAVGGVQIQNAGTIAGNLCNASPAADGMPPLLTLDAEVEIAGTGGTRHLPLEEFVTGPRRTALRSGEILSAILLPPGALRGVSAFEKLGARRYLVISILMVAVRLELDLTGRVRAARVAVGACTPVAQRLTLLERDLVGMSPAEMALRPDHLAPLAPISDIRADAAYRREAAAETVVRALRNAAAAHG